MRDPLDDLRARWNELEPPPLEPGEPADAATRATLAWLRAAWTRAGVPPVPRIAPGASTRFPWLPLASAAAAALVAALSAGVAFEAPPAERPAVAPATEPVRVVASTPERLELRSGAVTLVLLPTPSDPPQPKPQEFR